MVPRVVYIADCFLCRPENKFSSKIYIIYWIYNDFDLAHPRWGFIRSQKLCHENFVPDLTEPIEYLFRVCQTMSINRSIGHNVSVIFWLPVAGSAPAAGIECYRWERDGAMESVTGGTSSWLHEPSFYWCLSGAKILTSDTAASAGTILVLGFISSMEGDSYIGQCGILRKYNPSVIQ